tara:strand:+ start:311 stop:586 length:276 start_codon:yes stop_codon:yes gene_type:complete
MDQDAHVPDTMTRIRVLPTVAVVGQRDKVQRTEAQNSVLDVYVKFLPTSGSLIKNLMSLGKMIKGLPGVKIVRVISVNNRKVQRNGKPIVI